MNGLSEHDWRLGYNAMLAGNYISMSAPIGEDSTVCFGDFIFDSESLTPEQEVKKYEKWENLSYYAQVTIRLLIEMPDCVRRAVVTPSGHLIRKDSDVRFFCLICGIIGFRSAKDVFDEINVFMKDFSPDNIPDFRIEK